MKLVTFGDSWVWGDELEPKKILTPDGVGYDHNYNIYRHENNIGGIVNKNHTFTEYINYATNGGSNQHIIYDLMNYINSDDYDENDMFDTRYDPNFNKDLTSIYCEGINTLSNDPLSYQGETPLYGIDAYDIINYDGEYLKKYQESLDFKTDS